MSTGTETPSTGLRGASSGVAPSETPTWSGWSERQLKADLVTALLLGLILIGLLVAMRMSPLPGVAISLALLMAAAGARDDVWVHPTGVFLSQRRLWLVGKVQRLPLDVRLGTYKTSDDYEPTGLCFLEPELSGAAPLTGPWGPGSSRSKRAAVLGVVERALATVREEVEAPARLQLEVVAAQHEALDLTGALRGESGRVRELVSTGVIDLAGLRLPAGSKLRLNGPGFMDPARPDLLLGVTVGQGGTELSGGLEAPEGAELELGEDGAVMSLRVEGGGSVELAGWSLDLSAGVGLDGQGGLQSGGLAASVVVDGVRLPRGSRLRVHGGAEAILGQALSVAVSETVRLPDLAVLEGEQLLFDRERRLVAARVGGRTLRVPGWRIKGGAGDIPLTAERRLDVEGCRRAGLASREIS